MDHSHGTSSATTAAAAGAIGTAELRPTEPAERTYTKWDMASLWVGLVVNVPNYYLAGSLVESGMSWLEGVATVFAANTIILLPILLVGHAGTRYGVTFPVLARASFGVRGAVIPALLRALVACGWFGIETFIGGQAISLLLPSASSAPATLTRRLPWLGTSLLDLLCFLLFWIFQLAIVLAGMPGIKAMEKYSAPVLILLTLSLLCWAYIKAGGFGVLLAQPSTLSSAEFWRLFFPSVTAIIGTWSTLAVNIPDFTRFAKSQSDQILGQVGLPFFMSAYAFAGLAITSATSIIFGSTISNPVTLLADISGGWPVALLAMFGISLATITTNIAANVVAPATALVSFFPSVFTFKRGALLTSVLGLLCQPWRLFQSSQTYVYSWLVGISGLLGPVGGIILVDYWVLRRTDLEVEALYSANPHTAYYYYKGYNLVAMAALVIGVAPVVPGFFHQVGVLKEVPAAFAIIYDVGWFFGSFAAGMSYLLMSSVKGTSKASLAYKSLLTS